MRLAAAFYLAAAVAVQGTETESANAISQNAEEISLVIEPFEELYRELRFESSPGSLANALILTNDENDGSGGPLFGDGAMRFEYALERGGYTSIVDMLTEKEASLSCAGASHLSVWYKVPSTESDKAITANVRIILIDDSECVDTSNNYTCSSQDDFEYYFHNIDISTAEADKWYESKIDLPPLRSFSSGPWTPYTSDNVHVTSGTRGQVGNGKFDPGRLSGWAIQVFSEDKPTAPASDTRGVVIFDQLACVGDGSLLSAAFNTGATYQQLISARTWKKMFYNSALAQQQSNFTLQDGKLRMEYTVEQREDWGGSTQTQSILYRNSYFNLSAATHVSFDYQVPYAASTPDRVHLRLILFDRANSIDIEDFYSFYHILDHTTLPSESKTVQIKLSGDSNSTSPFWRTGWSGSIHNGVLDRDHILGFTIELNINPSGEIGSFVSGTAAMENLRATVVANVSEVSNKYIDEPDVEFFGKAQFRTIIFGANICKEACTQDPDCLYGFIEGPSCHLASHLTTNNLRIGSREPYSSQIVEPFWSDDLSKRGDFCDKCQCWPSNKTIDCRGQNLTILPKIFTAPLGAPGQADWMPQVLDLRKNPFLVLIGTGSLDALSSSLAEIRLPSSMRYISPKAMRSLVHLQVVTFEGNDAEWETDSGALSARASETWPPLLNVIATQDNAFGSVCCETGARVNLTSPSTGISFCEIAHSEAGSDTIFEPFKRVIDGEVFAQLQPSSPFMAEASESVQKCGAYCNIAQECRFFHYDDRVENAEPICFLLANNGTNVSTVCCDAEHYADEAKTQPGQFVGRPPRTRRELDGAVVKISTMQSVAKDLTGYEATFDVSLGSKPLRGAVWVEPHLVTPTALDITVSPKRVVLYDDKTTVPVTIRIHNAHDTMKRGGDTVVLAFANPITSCDVAFSSLTNAEALANNIFVRVEPPESLTEANRTAMITGSAVAGVVGLFLAIIAFLFLRRRKNANDDLFWAVDPSELTFDDPPVCIGQGSFGRVLLAEYRGTMTAVKRVIPPQYSLKGGNSTGRDSQSRAGDMSFSTYDNVESVESSFCNEDALTEVKTGEQCQAQSDVENGTAKRSTNRKESMKTGLQSMASNDTVNGTGSALGRRSKRKQIDRDEHNKLKADFVEEMKQLSKMRHPCITCVIGAVVAKKEEPMLVMEYMDHGSLYSLLHNETVVIEGELLLPILRDIAQGLRFLHAATPPVVHGDLKSANCLVDSKFRCKVADFGLSQKRKLGSNGTPFWMAPELLAGETNTTESDVYAFGVTLYEVYSRKDPYEGDEIEDAKEILRLVSDPAVNKRPAVPASCPPKVRDIMNACLASDPAFRPTFETLDKRLRDASVETVEPGSLQVSSYNTSKQKRTNDLLYDVFPEHIAEALRDGQKVEPETKECVTIFFADIVGFTTISSTLSPIKVSNMLDRLYHRFDELSVNHDVFKVETIGDCYMAVTNLVKDQPDHVKRLSDFSTNALQAANATLVDLDDPAKGCVNIRIGLHTGPVVANVVGSRNPRYCLFGDTVNTASRMESNSKQNHIHCSERTAKLLREQCPDTAIRPRGYVEIKGKGRMYTYWIGGSDRSGRDVDGQHTVSLSKIEEASPQQPSSGRRIMEPECFSERDHTSSDGGK